MSINELSGYIPDMRSEKNRIYKVEEIFFIAFVSVCIETDEQLQKAYSKLKQKKENYQILYVMLQEEVKKNKENSDKYKLLIGFKKLGEFSSILEAKHYAGQTGQTGRFSLLGDKYYDSWYISQWDIKKEEKET